MSPFRSCVAVAAMLAAGCASVPAGLGENEPAQAAEVAAGVQQSAAAESAPTPLVLNASGDNPGSEVICREMLKQGSNVIVPVCMTRDGWKRYKRQEAREAAAIVRTLQGGGFR